jgi:hypothetical protein
MLSETGYKSRIIQTSKRRGGLNTPSYISSLDCDGAAFLIQHSINGSALFSANEYMTEHCISTKEANAAYINGGGDPDSVARLLISPKDRPAYFSALCQLLVENPNMSSETSLILNLIRRSEESSSSNQDRDCVLCLCNLRASISTDGRELVIGTKFTPLPVGSEYLVQSSSSSSSSCDQVTRRTGLNENKMMHHSSSALDMVSIPEHEDVLNSDDEEDEEEEYDEDNSDDYDDNSGGSENDEIKHSRRAEVEEEEEEESSSFEDHDLRIPSNVGMLTSFDFTECDLLGGWDVGDINPALADRASTRKISSSTSSSNGSSTSSYDGSTTTDPTKSSASSIINSSGELLTMNAGVFGDCFHMGDMTFGIDESEVTALWINEPDMPPPPLHIDTITMGGSSSSIDYTTSEDNDDFPVAITITTAAAVPLQTSKDVCVKPASSSLPPPLIIPPPLQIRTSSLKRKKSIGHGDDDATVPIMCVEIKQYQSTSHDGKKGKHQQLEHQHQQQQHKGGSGRNIFAKFFEGGVSSELLPYEVNPFEYADPMFTPHSLNTFLITRP